MKITRVETLVLNLPMVIDGATPMLGGRARTSIDMLLVRIDTDAGVTGWGEAFGHRIFPATRAGHRHAARADVHGPRSAPDRRARRRPAARRCTASAATVPRSTRCPAIDIALWDIAGKVAGPAALPPAGRQRPRAICRPTRACCATARPTPWRATPSRLWRAGYRHIKLHEITVPEVQAAREVAGADIPIMVDTNCPWTVREAIEMARRLRAVRPALAGGAGVAAREPGGPGRGARRGRDRHRGRRELRHRVGVPPRVRGRGASTTRSRA